jgi:hypothetical protein
MTFVDPYEGRRRINPWTGKSEVNLGGPGRNCYVPPCPQPEDNWQPAPKPWETMEIKPGWGDHPDFGKVQPMPLPYFPDRDKTKPVPLPYFPDKDRSTGFPWKDASPFLKDFISTM